MLSSDLRAPVGACTLTHVPHTKSSTRGLLPGSWRSKGTFPLKEFPGGLSLWVPLSAPWSPAYSSAPCVSAWKPSAHQSVNRLGLPWPSDMSLSAHLQTPQGPAIDPSFPEQPPHCALEGLLQSTLKSSGWGPVLVNFYASPGTPCEAPVKKWPARQMDREKKKTSF